MILPSRRNILHWFFYPPGLNTFCCKELGCQVAKAGLRPLFFGVSFRNWDLENQLLLVSINFTPKTNHSCLTKMVHYGFPGRAKKIGSDSGTILHEVPIAAAESFLSPAVVLHRLEGNHIMHSRIPWHPPASSQESQEGKVTFHEILLGL